MNPTGSFCAVLCRAKADLVFLLVVFAAVLLPAQAQVQYTITDLGKGFAYDINNQGQVIGYSESIGYYLFSNGVQTSFTALGGGLTSASTPNAINDQGTIVGSVGGTAFMYSNGTTTLLPTLGSNSTATDVNNSGLIVGTSYQIPYNYSSPIGVSFTASSVTNLGFPFYTQDIHVNDSNQFIINSTGHSSTDSYFYDAGNLTSLTTSIYAYSINNSGIIAGVSASHATLYNEGNLIDLGTSVSGASGALGINNSTQVVGYSAVFDQVHGFEVYSAILWNNNIPTYLNSTTDLSGSNFYTLTHAKGINDLGQIIGTGTTKSGETHAFLLSPLGMNPVPEPSTYGTIGALGLVGLALRRRWKRRQTARSVSPSVDR